MKCILLISRLFSSDWYVERLLLSAFAVLERLWLRASVRESGESWYDATEIVDVFGVFGRLFPVALLTFLMCLEGWS